MTSGSNSCGEEDDRELGEGGKRLGGHLNGFASKKRRKQSKPIKIGAGGEAPPSTGRGGPASEDGRGHASSPEQGEYHRGSSADDEDNDLEEGERRPGHNFMGDFPLNLSSSRDGMDKPPMLRVLGAELLQHPDLDLSKLPTGMGRVGSPTSLPSSIYQSMLPFGLPPFPFPFPGHQSMKMPSSGGNNGPMGGRAQIFNPEAYCELCNKEFCNKYFLKTHKANKHGIYSDSPGVSRSPGPHSGQHQNVTGSSPGGSGPTPPTSTTSNIEHMGPPTPNSQAGSPFSGAFIAANMGSLRPPFLPLSPGASPSPTQHSRTNDPAGRMNGGQGEREPGEVNVHMSPRPPTSNSSSGLMSPREASEYRQGLEERDRLLQMGDKENGEIRKSLESPRSGSLNFNSMLFGGIPSLETLRKEEEMRKEQGRPIPSMQGGNGNGPLPKGPFTQEKLRQMGVINADAFCEICCKEFCNKYFLRVHKLKKHGICSPDLPPEKVQKILNQMAKEAGKTGNPPPPIIRPPQMPGGGQASDNKMRSPLPLGPGNMPMRPAGLINLPPLEPLMPLKDFSSLSPAPQSIDKMMNNRTDKMNDSSSDRDVIRVSEDSEDGVRDDSKCKDSRDLHAERASVDSNSSDTRESGEITRGRHGIEPSEDLQRLQSMIMELNSKQSKAHLPGGGPELGTVCKVCNKDMENKYFLRAHMMNEHGVLHMEDPPQLPLGLPGTDRDREQRHEDLLNGDFEGDQMDFATKFLQQMQKGLLPPLDSSGDERSFLERVKAELASSPKKMDKDPNRKPASLSRSYCEICKKELCNKYFMKTHMLKMHGINIEGGPPPPGLISTIGGGSNGSGQTGSVFCHICKKEMGSKYFLKVHLQNSHGINEDGSPFNAKDNGGLFAGLFPLGAPPPELLGLASSLPDSEHYFSRLLGEQSEISRERLKELERQKQQSGGSAAGHTCSLCGEGFPEIVALQVHIIKSHGAFPPDASLFGQQDSPRPLSPGEVDRANHRRSSDERSETTSRDGTPRSDHREERRSDSRGHADELRHNHAPNMTAPASATDNSDKDKSDTAANKQFQHIEMLQRHMLTQQFPGLINPLLSGFPGFPSGAGASLPFPNLQQLFGGKPLKDQGHEEEREEGERYMEGGESKTFTKEKKKRRNRFKCSKCGLKFFTRELCLRHIHKSHAVTKARRLHFSPYKSHAASAASKVRSNYVKQLMELLKVPTSRGTPQKSPNAAKTEHIMQVR